MNTMRLFLLVSCLFVTACGTAPSETESQQLAPSLVGDWTIHMIPTDRVVTTIPPPCDGTMSVTADDGAVFFGSWTCGAGIGSLEGHHVPEEGGSWIEFWTPPPSISPSMDKSDWLITWAKGATSPLTGTNLTATK
jgi:hypothetical protein